MKTHAAQIGRMLRNAERWAIAHPGLEYRRTVVRGGGEEDGQLAEVSRAFYEEACSESEYVGEIFAVKTPGEAVYSSFE